MIKLIDKGVSALAVTAVLGGLSLAHPVYAADASSGADETQAGGAATQESAMTHENGMKRVDERIKDLHDKLGVTAAQEPQWKNVTGVMQKNEAAIHKLVEARNANEKASAVEDLKSYEKIAAAHEQGLKRLIPAFEKFYNGLTPEQKTAADGMFAQYEGRMGEKGEQQGKAQQYNEIQPSSGGSGTNDNAAPGGSGGQTNDNSINGGQTNDNGTMAAPPAGASPSDQSGSQ